MRTLVTVTFPHEPFNTLVREGTVGEKTKAILDDLKPEAVYFIELCGRRTAVLIIDLPEPSAIPRIAEPWFLTFGADVSFHPAMTPEDLERAQLADLGKKWV